MKDVRDASSSDGRSASWIRASTKPETLAPAVVIEIRFLDRARVVVGEAVEPDDFRAAIEQRARQVRPDEPAAPVTSAFTRTPPGCASGSRHGLPVGSSAA